MSSASQPDMHSVSVREILAIPAVRSLWIAQIISVLGDFLAIFAVFSLVSFKLHGSPAEVSLIMISYLLPIAIVSPIAGVFVDRWHPRRTMIVSDLVRAVLVVALVWARSPYQIYAVFSVLSLVSAFFAPAQTVMLRSLVPAEGLMSANSVMMQAIQVVQIISPAIAGLLCKFVGEPICFVLDAVSFLGSALLVSRLVFSWNVVPGKKRDFASAVHDLREGVAFIFSRGTLAFTIVAMGAGLFAVRCYSALISVYVRDILHQSTGVFGMLTTMVGVGMLVGTMFIRKFARNVPPANLILSGLAGVAFTIFLLAVTGQVILTLLVTIGIGICVALIVISAQTVTQSQTPIEMLGRVSSSMMAVMAFAQVCGMALSGSVAQVIGIRNSYLASSALLFVVAAIGLRYVRKIQPQTAASAAA